MKHAECWTFLLWALPRMGFSADGFRRVRGQVCKRLGRRMQELGLDGHAAYRKRLATEPEEWRALDAMCRITVTRFHRDRRAFERLRRDLLPELADATVAGGRDRLRAWSAGCGGGEEPYTLCIIWTLALAPLYPALTFEIVATDSDPAMLLRAGRAVYNAGALRELPGDWISRAFQPAGSLLRLRPEFRRPIRFEEQDIRTAMPDGPFDLILCRYLAFTYFDEAGRRKALQGMVQRLHPTGILMVGSRECPPAPAPDLIPIDPDLGFWRRHAAA